MDWTSTEVSGTKRGRLTLCEAGTGGVVLVTEVVTGRGCTGVVTDGCSEVVTAGGGCTGEVTGVGAEETEAAPVEVALVALVGLVAVALVALVGLVAGEGSSTTVTPN